MSATQRKMTPKPAKNQRARVRQDNETARAIIIAALVTLAAFAAILVLSLTTP